MVCLKRKINVSHGREGMTRCVRRRMQIVTDVRESVRDAGRQEEEKRIIEERWSRGIHIARLDQSFRVKGLPEGCLRGASRDRSNGKFSEPTRSTDNSEKVSSGRSSSPSVRLFCEQTRRFPVYVRSSGTL